MDDASRGDLWAVQCDLWFWGEVRSSNLLHSTRENAVPFGRAFSLGKRTNPLHDGVGVWMMHRGVIYGPFNVIYGFGAALMCWLLLRKPYKNWQIFLGHFLLVNVQIPFTMKEASILVEAARKISYSGVVDAARGTQIAVGSVISKNPKR